MGVTLVKEMYARILMHLYISFPLCLMIILSDVRCCYAGVNPFLLKSKDDAIRNMRRESDKCTSSLEWKLRHKCHIICHLWLTHTTIPQ